MKFTKIKYDGKKVELSWNEKRLNGTELTHTLSSTEQPSQELPDAMKAFIPFVEDLLQLPDSWTDDVNITSLSINEEEDGRCGLVATCQKKVEMANSPLILNTPHLREPTKVEEEGLPGFLYDKVLNHIDRAHIAATMFVEGKRAQRNLFEDEGSDKKQLELAGATAG